MKATFAAILALAATTIASPFASKRDNTAITFSLTNDQTGTNAPATISVADTTFTIASLFDYTNLNVNGEILASSAQLVANPNNLNFECDIVLYGETIGVLTQDQTFANLEGAGNPLIPQNLNGAVIICEY